VTVAVAAARHVTGRTDPAAPMRPHRCDRTDHTDPQQYRSEQQHGLPEGKDP